MGSWLTSCLIAGMGRQGNTRTQTDRTSAGRGSVCWKSSCSNPSSDPASVLSELIAAGGFQHPFLLNDGDRVEQHGIDRDDDTKVRRLGRRARAACPCSLLRRRQTR